MKIKIPGRRKVCDETKKESRRKNNCHIKILMKRGGVDKAVTEDWPSRLR